jgi:hypothetical protein
MGALSFASRVVPGAGAFELSRSSRRPRVALNVRKSPVAALNAKAETRWTDPPPFPEVRSARARDRSLGLRRWHAAAERATRRPQQENVFAACLYSHRNAFFAETRTSESKRRPSVLPHLADA